MCDLQSEPWRANFTGPNCRCGVPTAGTDEERKIDAHHKAIQKEERWKKHKEELEAYKSRRMSEIFAKYNR